MNPSVFREYDIRGIAGQDFDEADITRLGKAMATHITRKGFRNIAVGRDCRATSDAYQEALVAGLLSGGIHVTDIGVCPTPVLYFAVHRYELDGGIMVTASHNPPEYNGFKSMLAGASVFGEELQEIRQLMERGDFDIQAGGGVKTADVLPAYNRFILKDIHLETPPKVVIDAGNGTGGVVAVPLLESLGCEVTPLYCEMDGSFPNHEADPTVAENLEDLIRTVKKTGADVGIGYDGDSDRIGVVDADGNILYGDQLMVIFARDILERHPGATFISEVKCSQTMYDDIREKGGNPIMWRTGHSLIKQKMKETGALLAGEMSGHMFFADRYYGFDDAIYATARLLEILDRTKKPVRALLDGIPETFNTPEIRVECPDDRKFAIVEALTESFRKTHEVIDIDGARILFADGWGLVRASNTQPALVLRFEATSAESRDRIRKTVEETLREIASH